MKIHCLYDELVDPKSLKPHEKNRNYHSENQIKQLAKILERQGWRSAIKVSKLSGQITAGHGRVQAALLNRWQTLPVCYQSYASLEDEYLDVIADNAIAHQSQLDLSAIHRDLCDIGPFDIDLLGFDNFTFEPENVSRETCKECGRALKHG